MRRDSSDFYVYVADHPVTGEPVYVGKGRGKRIQKHNRVSIAGKHHHNQHLARLIRKYGPIDFVVVRSGISEQEAFETERALIAQFGRANIKTGPLSNMTDGGEGCAGRVMTEQERLNRRLGQTGKPPPSKEQRAKISLALIGRTRSAEARAKASASMRGHVFSAETCAKRSKSLKGRVFSPETLARMSAGQKKRAPASLEARAKMAAARRGKPRSPETIAKMSASMKAARARKRPILADLFAWADSRL